MTSVLRAAGERDLAAIYEMAKSTGGGFTNLPPDRCKLRAKLDTAQAAFSRADDTVADDKFMFLLEDRTTGKARGTCQIFTKVGSEAPFYSFRMDPSSHHSEQLGRAVHAELLTLCTDHNGCSEVGGLFLLAGERSAGTGALLARSRYLFIKMHRQRFADRTIAELRGVVDEGGESPFWDGVAGRFFGISFREADEFNAINGHQLIADLMPKTPIYKAMLVESALHVLGVPHLSGRPAMRMLEKEGFRFDRYVDIFDGGPTMTIATDAIATIQNARKSRVVAINVLNEVCTRSIVATGRLASFRSCFGDISDRHDGIAIDPAAAEALGLAVGDCVTHVAR